MPKIYNVPTDDIEPFKFDIFNGHEWALNARELHESRDLRHRLECPAAKYNEKDKLYTKRVAYMLKRFMDPSFRKTYGDLPPYKVFAAIKKHLSRDRTRTREHTSQAPDQLSFHASPL